MIDIILSMYSFINAPTFVLAAIACSFLVKIYLLTLLIPYGLRTPKIHRSWIFLVGVLVGSMFGDITWIIKLIRQLSLISLHYPLLIFFVRISWAMTVLQYQSLAFFMQSITLKQFRFTLVHLFMLIISSSFAGYFIIAACCDGDLLEPVTRNAAVLIHPTALAPFEIRMMRYIVYYLHPLQIIPFFALTLGRLYSTHLPKILRKQCSTILFFFVIPYIAAEALQAILTFTLFQKHAYAIVALSTLLIAWCIHYCIRSIIQLRFLNFEYHVIKPKHNLVFFNNFKNILEQLSHTNSLQELNQTTHSFFTQAFGIGPRKTLLHIRHKVPSATPLLFEPYTAESIIEPFINAQTTIHGTFLKQRRILIYDDLEFTHFYTENELCKTMLTFMDNIHADIFIPIYEKNKLVAYIVVEKWARNRLYSDVERDQIIIFASFIGSVINLLEHRTLTTLLGKEKGLKEELYQKDQEINQYKESLKSFLRNSPQKEIGLIFYKNRRFVFGNTAAKKLVTINPNLHDGHPLTKIIKKIALQVTTYKAPQSTFTTLPDGKKLVVYGVPNVEQDTTILMLYYPEISDIITHNSNLLKDPTTRDYLLYLETTKSGQLINQLIPGSGEVLLNFKLNVLKASLSKKTVVLTMPEDD
ncbi:MAG TPA: hypothetical protein VLG71_03505, partial [Candidatus Limnocylindria bacterium]|nr:hypothetical protein [Candidatus Limnocylindria bacterium]